MQLCSSIYALLVIHVHLQYTNAASMKRSADEMPIKYPGPVKGGTTVKYQSMSRPGDEHVPEECRGRNFCHVKPPDYPEARFNDMLRSKKSEITSLQPSVSFTPNLANRQGDPDDTDDCNPRVTYEPLYKVRSEDNEWRLVVQAPDADFVQKVRLETCENENSPCFKDIVGNYTPFCKQKYVTWEILVATKDGKNGTEKIKTELPICCSCHYKKSKF